MPPSTASHSELLNKLSHTPARAVQRDFYNDPRPSEWLAERARFIGSLIGLTDEQFNSETAAGQWTCRVVAKHVLKLEQDSLKTIAADQAARRELTGRSET